MDTQEEIDSSEGLKLYKKLDFINLGYHQHLYGMLVIPQTFLMHYDFDSSLSLEVK